jgi:CRISPR-associated endonuclease/helicase Cas3
MQPSTWPDHLNMVLAKSADRGGETLAQHTWDVLEKLAALYQLRPTLSTHLQGLERLWHCLFWACFFHDFGKAAHGFQALLAGKGRWPQHHEVLSLAFIDWIVPALTEEEQRSIVAAIASHHRDASAIQTLYPRVHPDPLIPLLTEVDEAIISGLWHWVDHCASDWIHSLGFARAGVQPLPLMDHEQAVSLVMEQGTQRVRFWLRRYERWVNDLQGTPYAAQVLVPPLLLRGLTTTADHAASAHLKTMLAPIQEHWQALAARVLKPGQTCYQHQEKSAGKAGQSALLIAPTGAGKTEAALYWALGDGTKPVPRLFYVLPYQASMNAMFLRLQDQQKGFPAEAVGLQHGRAVQSLYMRLINQEEKPRTAAMLAAWEKNINMLHARPIKIFSPYQMLKAAFQLRGFEGMLADYAQAAFIFDEIHAYEPGRLALILSMMQYLREYLGARFFVMSATFPSLVRSKLVHALNIPSDAIIEADQTVFEKFRRHHLHLLPGGLLEQGIPRIVADVRAGKSVLVCVNSVPRAQAVYQALKAVLPASQLMLIHSRYILQHRISREREILQRCAVGAPSQPFVLVSTQVVEVSLNIDLDTIYSDLAPLEALLQRFGRVNRACTKESCPVYVFRYPNTGQYVYDDHLVRATLKELKRHDGDKDNIDESQITAWLDRIYSEPTIRHQWESEYQRMAQSAQAVLANVRPFQSDPLSEQAFEEMFDSVDVVPEQFTQPYLHCLENDEFLEASQYYVGISKKKYQQLERKGLLTAVQGAGKQQRKLLARLPYDQEMGLLLHRATPSTLNGQEENIDWD